MNLREKIDGLLAEGSSFFGLEFFPPKAPAFSLSNLYTRIESMCRLGPAYVSVTFPPDRNEEEILTALVMANFIQNIIGLDVLLHVTCSRLSKSDLKAVLRAAREVGCRNVLATLGAAYTDNIPGLPHAIDLVRFIKRRHTDVCVAVATRPGPDAASTERELDLLAQKVEAGAEIAIMECAFEAPSIVSFVSAARRRGIAVPILPGIMPIPSVHHYHRLSARGVPFPPALSQRILQTAHDDERMRAAVRGALKRMCVGLFGGGVRGVHVYTLNLERDSVAILRAVDLARTSGPAARALPFSARSDVEVRPIFWANRPRSYAFRAKAWDENPNGRWGHATSPAFGECAGLYQLMAEDGSSRTTAFVDVVTVSDVASVFCRYLLGHGPPLPWFEDRLQGETAPIVEHLLFLNAHGFLTVNSQPPVNSAPSEDASVGWGPPGGRVSQKGYVEFFCTIETFNALQDVLRDVSGAEMRVSIAAPDGGVGASWAHESIDLGGQASAAGAPASDIPGTPSHHGRASSFGPAMPSPTHAVPLSAIPDLDDDDFSDDDDALEDDDRDLDAEVPPAYSWMAIQRGDSDVTTTIRGTVGVTWGVFPSREVVQPTVVDVKSFGTWAAEAFALWTPQQADATSGTLQILPPQDPVAGATGPLSMPGTPERPSGAPPPQRRVPSSGDTATPVGPVALLSPVAPPVPAVIRDIQATWMLCCVVMEDYCRDPGDLFAPFREAVAKHALPELVPVAELQESCAAAAAAADAALQENVVDVGESTPAGAARPGGTPDDGSTTGRRGKPARVTAASVMTRMLAPPYPELPSESVLHRGVAEGSPVVLTERV